MAKPKPSSLGFIGLLLLSILSLSASDPDVPPPSSIHDLLRSKGLPAGLLPKVVRSYTIDESGRLEVFLDRPCLAKFEMRVFFDSVVRANLSYAALTDLVGLSQEELFLWLPVKDIIVDDPGSGLILFDIVVAHKQLSLSLFDNPPDCKPEEDGALIQPSGLLWNSGRKEKGFVSER
ncbi:hypothetical protein MRB53_024167 [Persea americana]|uniref:Uncharacterized protein n=2 Tax=Persea americana TaxID=3435 RepID=A0ACC2L6C8_PERAE|nr:hypothetical protein MRB53_022345 [Persea americana]KAJ8630844.1 hypothetical protein MRB53_024167 [Persea americana]